MWCMGAYVRDAVLTAVEHNLAGKKAKTTYVERPYLQEKEEKEKELTKEEKMQQVQNLFLALEIKKSNFERNHPKGATN